MKAALLLVALAAGAASPQTTHTLSRTGSRPGKVLLLSITIPAPRSEVWRAFSTSEGLSTWLSLGRRRPPSRR